MFEKFGRQKIIEFLKALDGELDRSFGLVLIGGTAAARAYVLNCLISSFRVNKLEYDIS